jgi:hypothetical protein
VRVDDDAQASSGRPERDPVGVTTDLVKAVEGMTNAVSAAHRALSQAISELQSLEQSLELERPLELLVSASRRLAQSRAHLEHLRGLGRQLGGRFGLRLPALKGLSPPPSLARDDGGF